MLGRIGDRGVSDNRYPVPDGFRQLLEALAREVLRGQPSDIYSFSALFFKVLLDMRNEFNGENPIQKPELYDKFKVRLFTEAVQNELISSSLLTALTKKSSKKANKSGVDAGGSGDNLDFDLNDPDLNRAATKIQARYRGFSVRNQELPSGSHERINEDRPRSAEEDPDRAATKIQANIRGYLTRKKYKAGKLKPAPRTGTNRRAIQRPASLEDKAASKIQAGVRGYLTRKQLASSGIPVRSPTSSRSLGSGSETSPKSPDVDPDLAASKIQAGIRGYLTRKQLAAAGMPVHSPTHHSHGSSHAKLDFDPNANEAASKIQAGVRGYLTRKQLEIEGLRKSPARHSGKMETRRVTIADVDDAATKIQAGIRGYLTRKHLESKGLRTRSRGTSASSPSSPIGVGGVVGEHSNHIGDDGIGSPDEAEEAAATKIQAAFRGHMVRQQFQNEKSNEKEHENEFV